MNKYNRHKSCLSADFVCGSTSKPTIFFVTQSITITCITPLMPEWSEIDVYNSSFPVCCSVGNIDMFSPKVFFTFKKERLITALFKNSLFCHYLSQYQINARLTWLLYPLILNVQIAFTCVYVCAYVLTSYILFAYCMLSCLFFSISIFSLYPLNVLVLPFLPFCS